MMRTSQRTLCLGLVIVASLLASPASAQSVPAVGEVIASRDRSFRIPFRVDAAERMRLAEVQLYVSTDGGQSWRLQSSGQPVEEYFPFTARSDGEYWFAVRTIDREGRQYPPTLSGVAPGLRVNVDTTPPEVSLRVLNAVGDQVGIEWEILDDNLEPRSLRVEFRTAQGGDWFEVPAEQRATGKASWPAGAKGPMQIRLRVLDRAGNEGLKEITLGAPGGIPAVSNNPNMGIGPNAIVPNPTNSFQQPGRPSLTPYQTPMNNQAPSTPAHDAPPGQRWGSAPPSQQSRPTTRRAPINVQLVNSTKFQINYSADEVGKSGLATVSLYYTIDGIHWELYGEDEDRVSPFEPVVVNGEGQYGFILVARSGAGVGDDPPAQGDPPQVTIEVDITPPEIRLNPPDPGIGPAAGILNITWSVQDINLDPRSISLFYAENAGGPWKSIAKDIENIGRYQWKIPPEVPFQFYVRLEAKDRAGNLGRAETVRPVIVDLVRPRIRILKVEPNGPPLSSGSPLSVSAPAASSEEPPTPQTPAAAPSDSGLALPMDP